MEKKELERKKEDSKDEEQKESKEEKINTTNGGTAKDNDLEDGETDLVEADLDAEEQDRERKEAKTDELRTKPLTEKSISLMGRISEYGYLTMNEIGLIYANQSYAYNVVKDLKGKGLLSEFPTTYKPRKAFYLKPRGYRTLEKYGQLRLKRRFLPQRFKPFIFNHRLASAKAGLILEKHPLVRNFTPESLLWERKGNSRRKLCDAEFSYLPPAPESSARVGLEVELTLKNRDKLVESFRALKDREDLHQVWWLCGDATIHRSLARMIQQLPWIKPQRHFVASFEDLLRAGKSLELANEWGTVYSINPDRPTLPGRYVPPPPPPPKPLPTLARAEAPAQPQPAPAVQQPSSQIDTRALFYLLNALACGVWDLTVAVFRWIVIMLVLIAGIAWGPQVMRYLLLMPPIPKAARSKPPAWQTRRILKISPPKDTWGVRGISLRSNKDQFKLWLRLGNYSYTDVCELLRATIHDKEGEQLGRWRFGDDVDDTVYSRRQWDRELTFSAPSSSTLFRLKLDGAGSRGIGAGCRYTEIPIEFN